MNHSRRLLLLLLFALAVLAIGPLLGMTTQSPAVIFRSPALDGEARIFWSLRLPRVLLAFLAGMGLAASGLAFQSLFRNPLATPFVLGVASGASLGAAAALWLGLTFTLFGIGAVSVGAFAGSLGAIFLVYGLTRLRRGFSQEILLLAGVSVTFIFSSLVLFIHHLSSHAQSFQILHWLMGSLEDVGFRKVLEVLPFAGGGSLVVLALSRELDLLATGEELALARGVEVGRIRHLIFFSVSLLVGGIVAACGPIGFVGLIVPHLCRLLVGPQHRYLAPATLLFGGSFLVVCDVISRVVIAPAQLPIGVVTALLGGPFFLWLLLGRAVNLGGS